VKASRTSAGVQGFVARLAGLPEVLAERAAGLTDFFTTAFAAGACPNFAAADFRCLEFAARLFGAVFRVPARGVLAGARPRQVIFGMIGIY
jgi:hypothetical protein